MGNARWRLEASLNYLAKQARDLGRDRDIEVVLADWGSQTPLRDVLRLSDAASAIVGFVHIPPDTAKALQGDSPFPEVLALNAAARRASGSYIGRIDQDTLVGARFLKFFFDLHEGRRHLDVPADSALLFANQRMVPYVFTSRSPQLTVVEQLIDWAGRLLIMEHRNPRASFYSAGVGIWLVHRHLWQECGGYDERMIYMNGMEVNMVRRLMKKYPLVNLGRIVNYDFYHLEHYHPAAIRRSSSHRKVNASALFAHPEQFKANDEWWGLGQHDLPVQRAVGPGPASEELRSEADGLSLLRLAIDVGPTICHDLLKRQRARVGEAVLKGRQLASIAKHTILSARLS